MSDDSDSLAEGVAKGVETGIKAARGSWRKWFNDKRLIIIYLVGVLILVVWVFYVNSQTRDLRHAQSDIKQSQQQIEANQAAVKTNCEAQNKSASSFNEFIDQAIQNANNTTGLTPAQKQAAIDKYAPLHQAILDCSHLAGQ